MTQNLNLFEDYQNYPPAQMFFVKKVFLKILQNSQENGCVEVSVSFFDKFARLIHATLSKITLTQIFSCKFCVIFQNTFL